MSSSTEGCSSDFARIMVVLKELGKETLLEVFKEHDLTDDTLDCLETQQYMRNELKGEKISQGVAIKFSKTWFSYKESGAATSENVPSTSPSTNKQSISERTAVSEPEEQRKQSQKYEANGNKRKKNKNLKENVSNECMKNVAQEPETKVKSVESDGGQAETTEEMAKSMEATCTVQGQFVDVKNNIVMEHHDTDTQLMKEIKSKECKQQPKSVDTEYKKGKSSKKKAPAKNVEEMGKYSTAVERKYCACRPFGQPRGDLKYEKGTAFCSVEDEKIEFKAITQETPQKLPWKIMEKARVFICGVLNSGEPGTTIYFGIGDSYDKATNFNHGEVVGLEVEDLMDEINKALQSTLDDHIKSDDGKMSSGEMKSVKIHYVPVWESNKKTSSYVVEVDVQRDWASCEDHVYYIEKWDESEKWRNTGKSGLHDLYKVKKGNYDEQAYIRNCGASQSVKNSEINKVIKEELSRNYKQWKDDESKKQYLRIFDQETENTLDTQKISNDIRDSLQKLNSKENDYILIANQVPQQYRGLDKIAFLKNIPWVFVFDLFDQKSRTDGLYYILNETNDSARVTVKNLEDYDDPSTRDSTTWIMRNQMMHEGDWTTVSKWPLLQSLSTCHKNSLAGRNHWVFLCLSDKSLVEMADIIDILFTIIGKNANKFITIISEKKEISERMIKPLKESIRKGLKQHPCSIFGISLDLLKINVQEMLGPNHFHEPNATTVLPHIGGSIAVLNKRINSLTNLEVYLPQPLLTTSLKEIKKARDDFYKGDVIKQINLFHRHDIERTLQNELKDQIDICLKKLSTPNDQEYTRSVKTVMLSYAAGSGATTLARRILWDKRTTCRCAVVKTIGTDTDYQIDDLQKFSYNISSSAIIPPVLILVDNVPEQQVSRLINKLLERETKCVLLNTIPISNLTKESENGFGQLTLGQLDDIEIQRVDKILVDVEDKDDEQKKAAVEILKRERTFLWLGLELFGRQYVDINERLSIHIQQITSNSLTVELKHAYEMILHFCCLLDYYSNGRSIYPHACILDMLDEKNGLDKSGTDQTIYIHSKFGGLLLRDHSDEGSPGWRPAHFLVSEVVRKEMDLVATAKKLFTEIGKRIGHAAELLIDNTVKICLQRESKCESPSTFGNDPDLVFGGGIEDDDFGLLEKQKYSVLLLDVMAHTPTSESEVINVLNLLITLTENVKKDEHKAYSLQQIARVLAYEVGTKPISHKDSLLYKLSLSCIPDHLNSKDSLTSGFEVAHQVIDLAVRLQPAYGHHLVTKGTFFKTELHSQLLETSRPDFPSENVPDFVKEAINITKKGISVYKSALEKTSYDSYLYAMFGKIEIIIILLEIFKNLPCFSEHDQGSDESFKIYMTFGKYPEELKSTLSEEDLKYFLSLRSTPSELLDEFFEEMKVWRKQSLDKHKMQAIRNAKTRLSLLRKRFYHVTKLDRTILESDSSVLKEDIVDDILFKHDETPYSAWKELTTMVINQIYECLKPAIPKETSKRVMLIYARAALRLNKMDELSQHVKRWWMKWPKSAWANLFNCMINFPVPNGSLKPDVSAVKQSISICKSNTHFFKHDYRKSSAEYFLGKGLGSNAILPSQEFEDTGRKLEMKTANNWHSKDLRETEFWRSKDVYEKLERLRGQKVKSGVLNYKGIEIMFPNERYPKESRDNLWFCLGFTLNGPYAYDPVDEYMFNTIKQGFSEEKRVYSDALNSCMSSPKASKKASTTTTSTLQSSGNVPPQKPLPPQHPCNDIALSAKAGDSWKSNEDLKIRARPPGGYQVTFEPQRIGKEGQVIHGALVKGALKSAACSNNDKCKKFSSGTCTFAHPRKNDDVRQTVCTLCTKDNKKFCSKKYEHKEYICDLGSFRQKTGEIWKSR